jgi:PAS domain S-box-containing protein
MNRNQREAQALAVVERIRDDMLGALFSIAEDGTVLTWNAAASDLYGYSPGDIVGRSVFETIVPVDQAEPHRLWLASVGADESVLYETLRTRRDGTSVWVDITARSMRDEHGERVIVLNARDVTRSRYRRGSEMLRARFRGALEAAPDAIVLVDRAGYIVLANSATADLFGYPIDDLLGERVELLVPSRFHRNHPKHREKYFVEPQKRPMGMGLNLLGRRKDGSEFQVEISLSPLDIDGTQLAMAAIRDVSLRKVTEEALRVAIEDLESFTYSVSHDLRAPIRQIDGFSKILAERLGPDGDPKVRHYLQRILDGTHYMGRLVDDLLSLARLGRQDIRLQRVALNSLVASIIKDAPPGNEGRTVEWRVGELPVADCDSGLLAVVFTNLISNALKYTRPRSPAIIEIGTGSAYGRDAIFVRDNGVGFDMKYADKLFGVFQRLHDANEFEGTGVGLATVHRIIRKHGGEIWADAAPDKGATFWFTLPEHHTVPGRNT